MDSDKIFFADFNSSIMKVLECDQKFGKGNVKFIAKEDIRESQILHTISDFWN